ncbi:sulfatase-like hydrolase/transferase [uncultured Draconibacterium sp.]|uniref:sulfatase-like hydrolase/transferase n=1 Tax=uncultured Draconibacterium sp. TaxID=1573823 RepID=UPI0025E5FAF1|nr:sulfatase-like hydrolase/transferase [uncultured Draconibacterium sp.]
MKYNLLLFFIFATLCHYSYAQEKPNILVISADDLNDFPSYANRYEGAITPNLDKLANRGMVFNNAYSQYTLCGPSRASLMYGFYPHNLSGK